MLISYYLICTSIIPKPPLQTLSCITYFNKINNSTKTFTFEIIRCGYCRVNVDTILSINVYVAIIQSIICSPIIYFQFNVGSCGRMHRINMDKKTLETDFMACNLEQLLFGLQMCMKADY